MATKTLEKTRLQILLTDEEGNAAKTFSLSRLNLQSSSDAFLALAKAIAGLQTLPVKEYRLVDTNLLSD